MTIDDKEPYGWIIDRDYITANSNPCYRVGVQSKRWKDIDKTNKIRFRCKDDDGIVYYGGWLVENDACDAQDSVLEFTMGDAGCVEVQVKRNGKWETEIS